MRELKAGKRVAIRVAIAASAAGAVILGATVAAGALSTGSEPTDNAVVIYEGGGPFDPFKAALGVRDANDLKRLQEGQANRGMQLATTGNKARSADLDNFVAADAELGAAVEELFETVAATPAAGVLQDAWRVCMAEAGTPFDSPATLYSQDPNSSDEADPVAAQNEQKCSAAGEGAFSELLVPAFPEWASRNQDLIERYRVAVGY